MSELSEMRQKLRSFYGVHTDSVISMIGLNPHRRTMNAVEAKDLAEAHAAQVLTAFEDVPDYLLDYASKGERWLTALRHWPTDSPALPTWFSRTVESPKAGPKVELKSKFIDIPDLEAQENPAMVAVICKLLRRKLIPSHEVEVTTQGRRIGRIMLGTQQRKRSRIMVVSYLQQQTKGLSSREARNLEGWKNSAMKEIEKLARENQCTRVFYSTGTHHATWNVFTRPVHSEVLETYGRLPMQHGYVLRRTFPVTGGFFDIPRKPETLWWVKKLPI